MLSIHASAFDFVEFVSAIHTLSKLNSVLAYTQISLNHNVNCVQVAGVQLFVGTQRAASKSAVKGGIGGRCTQRPYHALT